MTKRMGLTPRMVPVMAFAAALTSACGTEARAEASLIPSLEGLQPTIACIDNSSSEFELSKCVKDFGIADDYEIPQDPKTEQELTTLAVITWATITRGAGESISSEQFAQAIAYAECVEQSATALDGLPVESNPRMSVSAGKARVEMACAKHPLSTSSMWAKYPGLRNAPLAEQKATMLASLFANAAYRHVIEARGWVTNAMRECVHRGDGTRSAGCVGPRGTPPVVPPPPSPQ